MTASAASLLHGSPLFAELAEAELALLAERIVEHGYVKGQVVFREGDPGRTLFVIAEGLVKVFVTSTDGDEMVLALLRPPDAFGELALMDGGPRSASVEAVETTRLLSLDRDALLEAIEANPVMSARILASLGAVLRRMIEQASDLVFLDLHGRVAKLLVGMTAERGGAGEVTLDLPVTQQVLAGMVGGSRQSVNTILHDFEQRGFLLVRGRHVVVRDMEPLRRRAGLHPTQDGP